MREAAIVATARTAISEGLSRGLPAIPGASAVVARGRCRARPFGHRPGRVDDVYLGCGNRWNTQSYNLGRLTVHASRLPNETGGCLDRKCSSGLNALALAAGQSRYATRWTLPFRAVKIDPLTLGSFPPYRRSRR